jgi:predicted nucleic acid-binding protein
VRWVVLDTDVASRILKRRISPRLSARLAGYAWSVSFVTVGELWLWAETRSWGRRTRDELDDWLAHVVVIDSDENVSRVWARSAAAARLHGRARPTNDSWIAACCLARGLPLATYNLRDYQYHADHDGLTMITDS